MSRWLLILSPWCCIAFPGSWNTQSLPYSLFSFSRGLVSSLRTPMHHSITLNQLDNSMQTGNWHHLLFVGLVGDRQMIGLVSCMVRAIFHCACILLLPSTTVLNDHTIPQTMKECWFLPVITHWNKLAQMLTHMPALYKSISLKKMTDHWIWNVPVKNGLWSQRSVLGLFQSLMINKMYLFF